MASMSTNSNIDARSDGANGATRPTADTYPRQGHATLRSAHDLEDAIETLLMHGFNRADISVLAQEETVREKSLDGDYCRVDIAAEPGEDAAQAPVDSHSLKEGQTIAIGFPAYIGAAAAGIVGATAGGAAPVIIGILAGGAGGAAIGAFLARWVGEKQSRHLREQLECGGIILWTTLHDAEQENRFRESLAAYPGAEIDIR